jgi:hypothetical protein
MKVDQVMVNGQPYDVTEEGEGAANEITQYLKESGRITSLIEKHTKEEDNNG